MKKIIYLIFFTFTILYNKVDIKADTITDYYLEDLNIPSDIISKLNDYQKQLIHDRINNKNIYDSSQYLNVKFNKARNVTVDDKDPDLRLIYLAFKNTDKQETNIVFFYDWCKSNRFINILNEDRLGYNYNFKNTNSFEFYGVAYSKTDFYTKKLLETEDPSHVDSDSICFSFPAKYGIMPNSLLFGCFTLSYKAIDDTAEEGTIVYYHNYSDKTDYKELIKNYITVKNNINWSQNGRFIINCIIFIVLIGIFIFLSLTAKPIKK